MKLLSYYGRLARGAGYSVAKGIALPAVRRQAVAGGDHGMVYPVSTYSPWLTDERFQRVYARARRHTLVDEWRCYELWELVGQVAHVPGAILEVGAWRGGSGAILAQRATDLGIAEPVYICDTWEGIVKTGEIDRYYRDGKHDDASISDVRTLIDQLGLANVKLLQGIFPDETADQVGEERLRLVHIDVDVYRSAADVLDWAWERLSPEGVVVFDDYGCPATPGVTQLVNEVRSRDDRFFLHNLNGHAVFIKRAT
jgi:O-methyltransferase